MSSVPNPLVTAKRLSELGDGSTEIEQLVCARCQPLEAENAALKQALQTVSDENTELMREVAGLQGHLSSSGKREQALKAELNRVREEEPGAEDVEAVLQCWVSVTGRLTRKGRKPRVAVSSSRGQVVKKALRMRNLETGRHFTPLELCEALKGLGLKPYVGKTGRSPIGTKRYDEVHHALADEPTIERFIGYARDASEAADSKRDLMWSLMTHKAAEHELIADLLCREVAPVGVMAALDRLNEELAA